MRDDSSVFLVGSDESELHLHVLEQHLVLAEEVLVLFVDAEIAVAVEAVDESQIFELFNAEVSAVQRQVTAGGRPRRSRASSAALGLRPPARDTFCTAR